MENQKKLDILIEYYKKLNENRKDYIHDLRKKLAEIHGEGKFPEKFCKKDMVNNTKRGIYTA